MTKPNLYHKIIILVALSILDIILTYPSWHLESNPIVLYMGKEGMILSRIILAPLMLLIGKKAHIQMENKSYRIIIDSLLVLCIIWYLAGSIIPWSLYYIGIVGP